MPFITEEIWQAIANRTPEEALIIAKYPTSQQVEESLITQFDFASEVVSGIRTIRKEKNIAFKETIDLIITNNEEIIALDAKINIEDDSLFRHKDLEKFYDPNQLDPLEERAISANLAYVKLDGGEVGCMVNGAGLAMATMDITKKAGANPANFLDIGGSADQNGIEEAFKIITDDSEVKIILVNLFAGIARSDVVAKGIINAAKETKSNLPIVVTMRGTNADEGLELLQNSNLNITTATDLFEAAKILTKILPNLGD